MKLSLTDHEGMLEVAVFDEKIQDQLGKLNGPTRFLLRIKSTSKKVHGEILASHIVTKA